MNDRRCWRAWRGTIAALVMAAAAGPAAAQFGQAATAIENVRIITGNGEVIENGTILLRGDTIARVGGEVRTRGRVETIDGSGLTATPGLIDLTSGFGLLGSSAGKATHRASDGFDRYVEAEPAWEGGVTLVYLPGGGGTGVTGTGSLVRLSQDGSRIGEVMADEVALTLDLGSGQRPLQRLTTYQAVRALLKRANDYRESLETYEDELEEYEKKIAERAEKEGTGEESEGGDESESGDEPEADGEPAGGPPGGAGRGRGGRRPRPRAAAEDVEPTDFQDPRRRRPGRGGGRPGAPPAGADGGGSGEASGDEIKKPREPGRDPASEIILRAIDRELPVRIRADRSADIFNAIEVADEFGLRIMIIGGAEAHLMAAPLAEAEIPVVLDASVGSGLFGNGPRRDAHAGALLSEAGVEWYVGSGGNANRGTSLVNLAALVTGPDGDPIKRITGDAARLLGIDDQTGIIAEGRSADLVLWTGDPLDPASSVAEVWITGERVYQRGDE